MPTTALSRRWRRGPTLLAALALFTASALAAANPAAAADPLISQGKTTVASSTENAGTPASAATDGNTGTRWSSAFSDPQWIQVDLGASATVSQVVLNWEAAYARAFQIQVSADCNTNWNTIYNTTTSNGGVQTLAVNGSGRCVRVYGTQRATQWGYSLWEFQVYGTGGGQGPGGGTGAPPDSFWGDTNSIPAAHNVLTVKIMNKTNGKYPDSQVYWSFNGQTHSIAEQPYLDMPANSAGRMYFYLGSPTSQYNDFIEFTVGPSVFNGNTTRVDAFALKLMMRLKAKDGYDVTVGDSYDLFQEDRTATFQRFVNEVPTEFKGLAQAPNAPLRIPSPGSDPAFRTGGQYQNYFTAYAQSVGVNEPTSNITGCAGSMAGNPDMCAALNRHVATLPRDQWGNPTQYYKAAPANYYAKFWHDHGVNKLAYGFPYDDVAGQSSFISHGNPQWLIVAVGW